MPTNNASMSTQDLKKLQGDNKKYSNNIDETQPLLPTSQLLQQQLQQQHVSDTAHNFSFYGLSSPIIAVIASIAWMVVSSGLIFLNKSLLSGGFPYPMALSGLGMGFSSIASYITCHHLKLVEVKRRVTWEFYNSRIMPIGLLMALTLCFGNTSYLYLTVSFIQILKAFTPVLTMVALFAAKLEVPSQRLIMSVCVIAVGTAIASFGELNFSAIGVLIMMTSEVFEAVRLVMTQLLLGTGMKFHPIEGLMYLAPACSGWLFFGSLLLEFPSMRATGAFQFVADHLFHFCCAAVMGFLVNSLAYIIIQTASSLTLKVLGTVKNAIVVWLGIVVLNDQITLLQSGGYAMSIAAFYWYQRIKMEQISGVVKEESAMGSPKMDAKEQV